MNDRKYILRNTFFYIFFLFELKHLLLSFAQYLFKVILVRSLLGLIFILFSSLFQHKIVIFQWIFSILFFSVFMNIYCEFVSSERSNQSIGDLWKNKSLSLNKSQNESVDNNFPVKKVTKSCIKFTTSTVSAFPVLMFFFFRSWIFIEMRYLLDAYTYATLESKQWLHCITS